MNPNMKKKKKKEAEKIFSKYSRSSRLDPEYVISKADLPELLVEIGRHAVEEHIDRKVELVDQLTAAKSLLRKVVRNRFASLTEMDYEIDRFLNRQH